ncbi:MAG TPA: DUF4388 domain-containing protein [Candidatus Polarisedimenticolaceae bacterium]|nr:DUF4388 domain-containing protein [Candidatus Polarisedimenticolaceae bacterium]
MDGSNGSRLPSSLLSGRLQGISVPDLLWDLCRHRSTGVLHIGTRGITRKVYIDAGRIVFAASSDPNDRLGELLLREGVVTLDQLERAIMRLSGGKRLGAILVESGHLSPENLVRGVLNQVKAIVLGLFPLEDGDYAFAEGPLPTEEVVTLNMRTAEVLLQGIRQIRSFSRIRKSVGSLQTRYRLDAGWASQLDGLEIRDGERVLLQHLEAAPAAGISIDGLCREVFLSNYELYQALWAFRILGIVHEVDRPADAPSRQATDGRLDRVGLPELLVRLSGEGVTGVLRVTRGTLERTLHIKEGMCIFSTSSSIDDGLVAYLLRRGVISLRDREEAARRRLSNKRIGTILLEMGVIDESDLRTSVREQLSEIVFDTFRWDEGDWSFAAGELPTIEEITLHRSVEDLVFAGVRRVTSWTRVRDGCGGLGARLVLKPQYLAVLDRMSVGPEEWELISLLKTPKSVVEVCRESVLGDFRSCQILWALRLLGAIGEAALEASVDAILTPADAPVATPVEAPIEEPEVAAVSETAGDPQPVPLSAADETAEIVSEPWRLAAEKPPEGYRPRMPEPEPEPEIESEAVFETQPEPPPAVEEIPYEAPALDETMHEPPTIEMPQAAAPQSEPQPEPEPEPAVAADDGLPRFELGAPGTGLEDMKVDMRPADAPREFEVDAPGAAPLPEPEPVAAAPEVEPEPEPSASFADLAAEIQASALEAGHTMRISPEEVDAALRPQVPAPASTPAPAPAIVTAEAPPVEMPVAPEPEPVPPGPAWDPPAALEGEIAGFNARHVILFRALRTEVGAGAANFVRSCRASLANGYSEIFATAELRADGSWDPEALRKAIVERRLDDAGSAFRQLLEREMDRLRVHLGEKRATAIAGQLAAIP